MVAVDPVYTYLFTDLLTNEVRGSAALSEVTVQVALSAVGSFTASVDMSDARLRAGLQIDNVVVPRRTAYWVLRNYRYLTGGIVWNDDYDSDERKYTMTGATFDSYLDHLIVEELLAYPNTDLCTIAIRLWNSAQSKEAADIGVVVPAEGSVLAGTETTAVYDPSMQQKYGEAVQQLSQSEPGFDYYVDVFADTDGNPGKRLVLGDPYIGDEQRPPGLVLRKPGNVAKYTWPTVGDASPNDVASVGGGSGSGSLVSHYRNQAQIDAGFPLLQDTVSFKNVFDQPRLDSLTNAYGNAVSPGVVTPTVTLRPGVDLTGVTPGRQCRVSLEPDERFSSGLDTIMRVSSVSYTPQDAGTPEAVVLTLTAAVG